MEVLINNKSISLSDNEVLSSAIQALELSSSSGIAVALNNQVIPKTEWERTGLNQDDKITIISATAGG